MDLEGNTYIAGVFTGDKLHIGDVALTSIGFVYTGFVAKLDPSGSTVWARNFGSSTSDLKYLTGFAVDKHGNVYLSGSGRLSTPEIPNDTGTEFVIKYDTNGNPVWARAFGCSLCMIANAQIAVTESGSIYYSGKVNSPYKSITTPQLSLVGDFGDVLVLKLDINGSVLWSRSYGGKFAMIGITDMTVDGKDNVYIGGDFSNSNFDNINLNLTGNGAIDPFIIKINSDGFDLWSINLGEQGYVALGIGGLLAYESSKRALVADEEEHLYVGPIRSRNHLGHHILMLDSSGGIQWQPKIEASLPYNTADATFLSLDRDGTLYLAGNVTGDKENIGVKDPAVWRVSSSGKLLTLYHYGGYLATAITNSISINDSGIIVLGGYFKTANFSQPPLDLIGLIDGFVVRVTATDNAPEVFNLTISKSGSGRITSTPAGIDCGNICSTTFDKGTQITINAKADNGNNFIGWFGACNGVGACSLTMDKNETVTAKFETSSQYFLQIHNPSTGLVRSDLSGIYCGQKYRDCKASFPQGSEITLTADSNPGYMLKKWAGCTSASGIICKVALNKKLITVKPVFVKLPRFKLKITKNMYGNIISTPARLKCNIGAKSCSTKFVSGTYVSLKPIPQEGRSFIGWAGDCTGVGSCEVLMDRNRKVGATFK